MMIGSKKGSLALFGYVVLWCFDVSGQRGHSVQVVRPCVSMPTLQQGIQGYLAHKKQGRPMTLRQDYA